MHNLWAALRHGMLRMGQLGPMDRGLQRSVTSSTALVFWAHAGLPMRRQLSGVERTCNRSNVSRKSFHGGQRLCEGARPKATEGLHEHSSQLAPPRMKRLCCMAGQPFGSACPLPTRPRQTSQPFRFCPSDISTGRGSILGHLYIPFLRRKAPLEQTAGLFPSQEGSQ